MNRGEELMWNILYIMAVIISIVWFIRQPSDFLYIIGFLLVIPLSIIFPTLFITLLLYYLPITILSPIHFLKSKNKYIIYILCIGLFFLGCFFVDYIDPISIFGGITTFIAPTIIFLFFFDIIHNINNSRRFFQTKTKNIDKYVDTYDTIFIGLFFLTWFWWIYIDPTTYLEHVVTLLTPTAIFLVIVDIFYKFAVKLD